MKIYKHKPVGNCDAVGEPQAAQIEPNSFDGHIAVLNKFASWVNGKGRKYITLADGDAPDIDTAISSIRFAISGMKKLKYVCAKLGQ